MMSSWLEKVSDAAVENFKAELNAKATFVQQICTDDFPEEIAMALFQKGVSLKEIDQTYLEERILMSSSHAFNKDRSKEQQRATAIESLGYTMAMLERIEESL